MTASGVSYQLRYWYVTIRVCTAGETIGVAAFFVVGVGFCCWCGGGEVRTALGLTASQGIGGSIVGSLARKGLHSDLSVPG